MDSEWYVCYQDNDASMREVKCFGGFKTALEADDFYKNFIVPSAKPKNSTLLWTVAFFPKILKRQHVQYQYAKSFNPLTFRFDYKLK